MRVISRLLTDVRLLLTNIFWAPIPAVLIPGARSGRFKPRVYKRLRQVGWYPGRSVPVGNFAIEHNFHEPAMSVLREFGGLVINRYVLAPGISYGDSPFAVEAPDEDWLEIEDRAWYRSLHEAGLNEVGMLGIIPLYVGADGRVWHASSKWDRFQPFTPEAVSPMAQTFDRALELIVLGKRSTDDDIKGDFQYPQEA